MKRIRVVVSLFIMFAFIPLFSQQNNDAKLGSIKNPIIIEIDKLPQIESLSPSRSNTIFREYQNIIESNSKAISSGRQPEILFFKYKNTENFTFQGLAARCCINQETLATLNRIENAQDDIKNRTLILPCTNGIFVAVDKGINSIEVLLQKNYSTENLTKGGLYYTIDGVEFVFLQKVRFSPTERAYFLDSALCLPISSDSYWVSSEFGKRRSPFSGQIKNHNGIDLAAAEGTPVYAIKDGAVYSVVSDNPEFGNYIILSHDAGKMTSVYAHLSKVVVEQYQNVKKGQTIGYVGHTGMATGSHLHFEIRKGGKAEDPALRLNLKK